MFVFQVSSLHGELCRLALPAETRLPELKQAIEQATGISVLRQRLLHGVDELTDADNSLAGLASPPEDESDGPVVEVSLLQQPPGASEVLPFVVVGRVADAEPLAQLGGSVEAQEVFKRLLTAAPVKLAAGERRRLLWGSGTVCMQMDRGGELLLGVFTAEVTYPERFAWEFLANLSNAVNKLRGGGYEDEVDYIAEAPRLGLNDALEMRMVSLVAEYSDPQRWTQPTRLMEVPVQQQREGRGVKTVWAAGSLVLVLLLLLAVAGYMVMGHSS